MKIIVLIFLLIPFSTYAEKHLFILSGQSNMARFKSETLFNPIVEKEFGKKDVIIVKSAQGGQPISRWYKDWKYENGKPSKKEAGDLYELLISGVKKAIEGQTLKSVTFVWMQGEADAKSRGSVYKSSLKGLVEQIKRDLKIEELNIVIGRISDYDMKNEKFKQWALVRKAQEEFVKETPNCALVNTDDVNDEKDKNGKHVNGLHYTKEGYKIFGERLAAEAIGLIQK